MEKTQAKELPRDFPPCTSISPQARGFMTQSIGTVWETADLSPTGIATLRRDNSDVGALAWEVAKKDCPVTLEDAVVGGVPCQWVSPITTRGPEIVLFLYGGAFVVGSPEDDLSMTARFASCMSLRVCVPRYRLAPEHPFPAAHNDVMAVYRSLIGNGCGIFIVGESAGGNLALGLVLGISNAADVPLPLAVAMLSPWIDLTHSGDSHATLFGLDPTLSIKHFLEPASLAYAGQRSVSDTEISLLFAAIPANFPPTIIITATRDLLLSDSIRIARKLRTKNCIVDLRVAEGLWHVFEWYPQCPEAVESLQEIATFLEKFCNSRSFC